MTGVVGKSGKRERHREIVRQITEYVSNPKNFENGSKTLSEIARELGLNVSVVAYNTKILYYKKMFPSNVVLIEKPKITSVFTRPVESTG